MKARYGFFEGSDQIPGFASLDLGMRPIQVDAGGQLDVDEDGATLTDLVARRYDLADFTVDGLPEYDGPRPRDLDTDVTAGTGRIQMPGTPGSWVIELSPSWRSRCWVGDGITWVVVRTR
ncbi:MAG TPA: hypothetical protein VIZ22_05025 [Candidatus Limnocylindrales bacterium]